VTADGAFDPVAANPGFAEFEKGWAKKTPALFFRRRIADLETPVSAFLKLGPDLPYSFLLESVQGGETRGRYSIIAMAPDLVWRCKNGVAETAAFGKPFVREPARPLESLRSLTAACRLKLPEGMPPMVAGLFGYLGYDMVREMEKLPDKNPDVLLVPDAVMVRPSIICVFDNVRDELLIVTIAWPRPDASAAEAYAAAMLRLDEAEARLSGALPETIVPDAVPVLAESAVSNTSHADYLAVVERAKEYIRAGDVFQVVPSQRFRLPFALPPFSLYRSLRRLNPSPFLFFLNFPGYAVVGSSPEILVRLRNGKVTIRPIAGTAPRGANAAEDADLAARLIADPKERAEHLMLLDLGRNDVGRVVETGSVRVTEQFIIERYSHVMHIVSNVEGDIAPGKDAIDALVAGFPAGTLTGAPKVRAMEIIDELERERRGIYAGAVGYIGADGSMDTCIVLRTAVIKDGTMYVQAGGGVVADSDPQAEYMETINKSKALIRAAEDAIQFVSPVKRNRPD